jgi:hypothetical protein
MAGGGQALSKKSFIGCVIYGASDQTQSLACTRLSLYH